MSSTRSLVSVVVPAWNAARTIRETLKSVAAQTHRELEVIIVDDGSTDSTAEIAAEFCASERRARLIRKENGGVASARNAGFREAEGRWVAPIDADDLWHHTKIEKQLAVAEQTNEPPGFVYCWSNYLDGDGRVTGSAPAWSASGSMLEQLAYINFVGNGSAPLFSRDAVLEVGGYEETLRARGAQGAEDLLLQLKVARRHRVDLVPEYLVGYQRDGERMSANAARMTRSLELVFGELRKDAFNGCEDAAEWALAMRYIWLAQEQAVAGDYAKSARNLIRGVGLDPTRSSLYLMYRTMRLLRRLALGRRKRPEPIPFEAMDPKVAMNPDPDELPALAGILRKFDEARLKRLAATTRRGE